MPAAPDEPSQAFVLERIDRGRRMAKYYVLALDPTLFADVALTREWGRLGAAPPNRDLPRRLRGADRTGDVARSQAASGIRRATRPPHMSLVTAADSLICLNRPHVSADRSSRRASVAQLSLALGEFHRQVGSDCGWLAAAAVDDYDALCA
jgi:hypothetical protein